MPELPQIGQLDDSPPYHTLFRVRRAWVLPAVGSLVLILSSVTGLRANDQPPTTSATVAAAAATNLTAKSLGKSQPLGGVQFWGDVQFFQRYHIQQNPYSKRYRLLGPDDRILAFGTLAECRQVLQEIRNTQQLLPLPKTATILLHGFLRSDQTLRDLRYALEQHGRYVIPMNYPSVACDLQANAEHLRQVMDSLEGVERIDLVGFSLGGCVIRAALAESSDSRIGRIVFVGSPQHGAELATDLCHYSAINTIAGPAVANMAQNRLGAVCELPIPPYEFGIINGARGTRDGFNPLIPGDDDGVVGLSATRLCGASDELTVPYLHHQLLHRAEVYAAVQNFLEHGRFLSFPNTAVQSSTVAMPSVVSPVPPKPVSTPSQNQ